MWEFTEDGAYIRGQYPAVTSKSTSDWTQGYGAYFVLASNTAGLASLALAPLELNSLTVGYGFSIIQQALLPSATPETLSANMTIENGIWYRIKTVVTGDNHWLVYVNDTQIADVNAMPFQGNTDQVWGSGSLTTGSFGFGPWYSQAAWYKDVVLTASNGTVLYTSDFIINTDDTLLDYAVHSNPELVCLDGPKRDRDAWIGDFAHTVRSIVVSSGRTDYIKSMIELDFTWQQVSGEGHNLVPIAASIGTGTSHAFAWYSGIYGEAAYESFSCGASFFTAQGEITGTAPTALFVKGLRLLSQVATILGDTESNDSWNTFAKTMTDAINNSLWTGQFYGVSPTPMGSASLLATAFTIQGGIATDQSSSGSIAALANNESGWELTGVYWPVMVNQSEYYTNASWEYTYPDGSPGIGLFTSLGHSWGGAPTYVYTNYLLGLCTQWNDHINNFEWIFYPVFAIAEGLSLTWVKGTVPLASGGSIEAGWEVDNNSASGYTTSLRVVGSSTKVADMTQ
ncbi:hypothetical protein SEUCBS139899_005581 [Sporothrix eucalyptigena]